MKIDWNNKQQVISYADMLGKGMTVYKSPFRPNYNITHTERFNQGGVYEGCEVIHQS